MNTCKNCGVELDTEMNYCPLCGQKANVPGSTTLITKGQKASDDVNVDSYGFHELTESQKQKVVWELSAIIIVAGVAVSLIVDLLGNKEISWSKYTVSIGLFLFANISFITFLQKRALSLVAASFVTAILLLLALDWYSHRTGWGTTLGIPIVVSFYFSVLSLTLIYTNIRQKGLNLVAYFMLVAGFFCMCIEGIVSKVVNGYLTLQWSLILFVSVVSVSVILLFIHYRIKRVTDLKKFFHI
jgi:hypothetical protein